MLFIIWSLFIQIVLGNITQESSTEFSEFNSTESFNVTELSMEESSLCYNSTSCFNTTFIPTPSTTTTRKPRTSKKIHHEIGGTVCSCDLLRTICDINCCCDPDCSYEKKKLFDHCEPINDVNIDRRSCRYSEIYYENFTLHEWDIENNDLFCVVRRNAPPTYTLQKEDPYISYEETLMEKDVRYDWPNMYVEEESTVRTFKSYVQGSPLFIIVDNSTIETFKVSEGFISSGCDIQNEVNFLYNINNECVHVVSETNNYLNLNYYRNHVFIAKPQVFNRTKLGNNLLACKEPICVKASLTICRDPFMKKNCMEINDTLPLMCAKEKGNTKCTNVIRSLSYRIYQGSEGIQEINLCVHLVNVTHKTTEQYEINQSISVKFEWAGTNESLLNIFSGNPGYLIDKPILMGTLVNGSIIRDPELYENSFLVLPFEEMGVCLVGNNLFQLIEFGYDIILDCMIKNSLPIKKEMKADVICKELQMEIFKYWGIEKENGYFVNRTFGHFGNANVSEPEEWKELLYEMTPKDIIGNISGNYSNRNLTVSCKGLVFGLTIDIYHARVDLRKLIDQEKILGITYEFHNIKNRTFVFEVEKLEIDFELELDTRVKFWDVTSTKIKKIVDPPSLNIKLPSDFFYPFVKVTNGCIRIFFPKIVSLSILFVLVFNVI